MSGKIRWGILGTGSIARTFVKDFAHVDSGVVAAVGSRRPEKADSFADDFGISRRYASYEALVQDPDIDVIYVATPHSFHHDHALLALNADKAVLVEKAFTMSVEEAEHLVAVARTRNLFLMEAMWTRFLPHVAALRDVVASGELGEIVCVIADHGQRFEPDATSRLFAPELGGGAMLDLGVYPVSFASMLLGPPSHVCARVTPAFTGVDATASAILTYDSGAHALVTCTSSAKSSTRASIIGTRARVEIAGDFYAPSSLEVIEPGGARRAYRFEVPGRGLHFEARHVAECLFGGLNESPVMSLEESIQIVRTMLEIISV